MKIKMNKLYIIPIIGLLIGGVAYGNQKTVKKIDKIIIVDQPSKSNNAKNKMDINQFLLLLKDLNLTDDERNKLTQKFKDGKPVTNILEEGKILSSKNDKLAIYNKVNDSIINLENNQTRENFDLAQSTLDASVSELISSDIKLFQERISVVLNNIINIENEEARLAEETRLAEEQARLEAEQAEANRLAEEQSRQTTSMTSTMEYTLDQFMFMGIINWGGYKFSFYSQAVLPGGGLQIPGRHVNANGYVVDGDGYIVLANDAPKGTIFPTPFGAPGKVYDRGTSGNHLDVYVR